MSTRLPRSWLRRLKPRVRADYRTPLESDRRDPPSVQEGAGVAGRGHGPRRLWRVEQRAPRPRRCRRHQHHAVGGVRRRAQTGLDAVEPPASAGARRHGRDCAVPRPLVEREGDDQLRRRAIRGSQSAFCSRDPARARALADRTDVDRKGEGASSRAISRAISPAPTTPRIEAASTSSTRSPRPAGSASTPERRREPGGLDRRLRLRNSAISAFSATAPRCAAVRELRSRRMSMAFSNPWSSSSSRLATKCRHDFRRPPSIGRITLGRSQPRRPAPDRDCRRSKGPPGLVGSSFRRFVELGAVVFEQRRPLPDFAAAASAGTLPGGHRRVGVDRRTGDLGAVLDW